MKKKERKRQKAYLYTAMPVVRTVVGRKTFHVVVRARSEWDGEVDQMQSNCHRGIQKRRKPSPKAEREREAEKQTE